MKSRAIITTQEQRDNWSKITGKSFYPKGMKTRRKKYFNNDPERTPFEDWVYYMGNCMFWVKEYQEGRCDKKRFTETINAIKGHLKNIEDMLPTLPYLTKGQ